MNTTTRITRPLKNAIFTTNPTNAWENELCLLIGGTRLDDPKVDVIIFTNVHPTFGQRVERMLKSWSRT